MTQPPTPFDRKLYGDMVDDVYELRAAGHDVARFKGDFRVGNDVLTAAQLRGKAAEIRARRQIAKAARQPDAPRTRMARHEIEQPSERPAVPVPAGGREGTPVASRAGVSPANIVCAVDGGKPCPNTCLREGRCVWKPDTPTADVRDKFWRAVEPASEPTKLQGPMPNAGDGGETAATRCRPSPSILGPQDLMPGICGCGRPKRTCGRCWFKRGLPGPLEKRAVGRPLPKVCEKCGGPRSYWSTRLCQKCYRPEPPAPRPSHEGRITSLEAELAATKADFAAFKDTVKAAVADLVAHLGLGEDR